MPIIMSSFFSYFAGSVHHEEFETDGSKDKFRLFESTLFSDCMKRFLCVRCYNSSELIAALKASSICL